MITALIAHTDSDIYERPCWGLSAPSEVAKTRHGLDKLKWLLLSDMPPSLGHLSHLYLLLIGTMIHFDADFELAVQRQLFGSYAPFSNRVVSNRKQPFPTFMDIQKEIVARSTAGTANREKIDFMQILSQSGSRILLRPFLEAGYPVDTMDQHGRTLVDLAVECANLETFDLLLEYGAVPMYWRLPRSETSLTTFGASLSRPLTVTQIKHFNTQIMKRTFSNIDSTQRARTKAHPPSLLNKLLNSSGDYHRIGTRSFKEHVGTFGPTEDVADPGNRKG